MSQSILAGEPLLAVRNLTVEYGLAGSGLLGAIDVSLSLGDGEAIGLVGESGSGKTTVALAIAGLLPPRSRMIGGEVIFRGRPLPVADDAAMRPHRWRDIAVVFQGSMHALNPVHRISSQIAEPLILQLGYDQDRAMARVRDLLELVGIPARRAQAYPHELSGGMRQRVMIAMALACDPAVLIADEPTTALDVLTQAQVLALLGQLRSELRLSLLLITHDLGVVAEACDRVIMMYARRVVEDATIGLTFTRPRHPYTKLLLETIPNPVDGPRTIRTIPGSMPDINSRPSGCTFHDRCPWSMTICRDVVPELETSAEGNRVACHLSTDLGDFAAESNDS